MVLLIGAIFAKKSFLLDTDSCVIVLSTFLIVLIVV